MAYTTVTRAVLRARLKDRYTGDAFWTDTDANDALNETLRYFNLFTGYWRGSATANTGAATPFLTVPGATLTAATRVYVSGRVLTKKSILELYRSKRNWRTQTTSTGAPVPSTIREWAPIGLGAIAVWPHTVAGGTTLTFDGVRLTPVLGADGSTLDLGNEELSLILGEALWVLSFKRPSTQPMLKELHTRFLQGCFERNDQLRGSAYFREVLGLNQQQRLRAVRQANAQQAEVPQA